MQPGGCQRLTLILPLFAALILSEPWLLQPVQACFSQSHLYQRRESSGRQRANHAFAYGEYQPKMAETALQASGPEGQPIRQPRGLITSGSELVVFSGRRSTTMTQRCKEKLEQLALLVRNKWNGQIRLRVHNAWMPKHDAFWDNQVGHRGLELLHHSARAVDMSLVVVQEGQDHRDATLGSLAQLAFYQAYFDYCKVLRDTVHCSVKSDNPKDADWLACFPAAATVVKRNKDCDKEEVVKISSLKSGDEVLTLLDEKSKKTGFTRVIGHHHRVENGEAMYIRIGLANGRRLEISPNHLVFASASNRSDHIAEPVYAASLTTDQYLMTASSPGWSKIVSISNVHRLGLYAPITTAGHLLVDGVWVSSYAQTRHQSVAHALFAPVRWLDGICQTGGFCSINSLDQDGVHWYSSWLYAMARALAPSWTMFPN